MVRCGGEVTRNNLADIQNLDSWKRQRPEIRKRFLYPLGLDPMPPKTPIRARITGELQRDGYRVENVVNAACRHRDCALAARRDARRIGR